MKEPSRRTQGLQDSKGKENKMNKDIRIMLIDDHELVRYGLRHMLELEEDIEVVGDYSGTEEAFLEMGRLSPHIILMDTEMPGMNGIEATRSLKRDGLDYGVDVIMLAESAGYQAEALKAGVAVYLLKDITRAELVQAIKKVYQNKHSLEKRNRLVEEAVELVVPPPANAAKLLNFMCQLEERLNDNHNYTSIMHTVGTWDWGTVITVLVRPTASSNLLDQLGNMPDVEKVEEEPLARGAFFSFPKKFGALPRLRISPSKRFRITLKETDMAGRELVTVLN